MPRHLRPWLTLLLTAILVSALTVTASANSIHTVEMDVVIHPDGSAVITEYWDITMTNNDNTEWYVAKHNLDNMAITGLTVVEQLDDGTEEAFETLGRWDVGASRSQKAGKCGLVATNGGYEVCWGFGTLGRHRYTVTYTITDIVKGYEGGDAMSFNFLSEAAGGADILNLTLSAQDFPLEYPATRVWVFGYEAESAFQEGAIRIESQGRFRQGDYAAVLLVFEPGLLSPGDTRSEPVDDIIQLNMEGSIWEEDHKTTTTVINVSQILYNIATSPLFWFPFFFVILPLMLRGRSGRKAPAKRVRLSGAYSNVDYCRDLPFQNNIYATYVRLKDLHQVDEGSIIGCYLLKWVRSRQVDIVNETVGAIKKREEPALHLYEPRDDMPRLERRLYEMILEAAGRDGILQSREFEKWARRKYARIGRWLDDCHSTGSGQLDQMGAYQVMATPQFFGMFTTQKRSITPFGEDLTRRMFGFVRYLQEFTIINEREAREVQLWDNYLIYAQLFGIADQVAQQFQQLYPNYFVAPDAPGVSGGTDILVMTHVSDSFSRSMHSGYRSGVSAANSSSSSGGGGSSSSSGGGGGSSGGGGAGGR